MGPKTARKNVRKIEVPTDTPTEFEQGDTAAGRGGGKRENRERGRGQKNNRGRRERKSEGRKLDTHRQRMHTLIKMPRTERSKSEMDTEGGGKAATTTPFQSKCRQPVIL